MSWIYLNRKTNSLQYAPCDDCEETDIDKTPEEIDDMTYRAVMELIEETKNKLDNNIK